MEQIIINHKGEQFDINTHFAQEFKGRGGWNINCEVEYRSEKKTFRHYTTDSRFINNISDMKADDASYNEIQEAYSDKVFNYLVESILEWCENVDETK